MGLAPPPARPYAPDEAARGASVDARPAASVAEPASPSPGPIIRRKAVADATPPSSRALAPKPASLAEPLADAAPAIAVARPDVPTSLEPPPPLPPSPPQASPERDPEPLATVPPAPAKAARREPREPAEAAGPQPLDPVALFDPTPRYFDESKLDTPELAGDEGLELAKQRPEPEPSTAATPRPRRPIWQPVVTASSAALAFEAPAYEPLPSRSFEREAQPATQLYIVPRAPRVEPYAPAPAEAPTPAPRPAAAPSSSASASEQRRAPEAAVQQQHRSPVRQRPSIDSISQIGPLDRHFPNRRAFRQRYR